MPLRSILSAPELAGTSWSVVITTVEGSVSLVHEPDRRLRTASIAKLLLLATTADRIASGTLDPATPLSRRGVEPVADSGLWQHLDAPTMTVADLATLIAAVSDNLATNVLLDHIGTSAVAAMTDRLMSPQTALLDRVRDRRESSHPETLSVGTAADWASFFVRLAGDRLLGPEADALLRGWLERSVDLSMVGAAMALDPLAHTAADLPALWNKTGTDAGVRADVGLIRDEQRDVAYAALCNWSPERAVRVDDVLAAMRAIGALARECGRTA